MKICFALNCNKPIDVETIIHHHAKEDKCNPYDNTRHCYFELCMKHYKKLHKNGENKLVLKDEHYEKT